MRIKKTINLGIIGWSNTKISKLTIQELMVNGKENFKFGLGVEGLWLVLKTPVRYPALPGSGIFQSFFMSYLTIIKVLMSSYFFFNTTIGVCLFFKKASFQPMCCKQTIYGSVLSLKYHKKKLLNHRPRYTACLKLPFQMNTHTYSWMMSAKALKHLPKNYFIKIFITTGF